MLVDSALPDVEGLRLIRPLSGPQRSPRPSDKA